MKLRIVAWNCNLALHDKYNHLLALKPDLAIVPECAEPDVLRRKAPGFEFSDCEWQGDQVNRGLGVFTFGALSLRRHQSWERHYHLFLPLEVRGAARINLLAVWAFNDRVPATVTPNPKTTKQAVAHYAEFLRAAPPVVAGDFNASIVWDDQPTFERFGGVDDDLRALGLESAYHRANGHTFGQEPDATHFWQKNAEQRYHIDYVYLPTEWQQAVRTVAIGGSAEWLARSDHAPRHSRIGTAVGGACRFLAWAWSRCPSVDPPRGGSALSADPRF
jgi:exodeoxyribonuclease-3